VKGVGSEEGEGVGAVFDCMQLDVVGSWVLDSAVNYKARVVDSVCMLSSVASDLDVQADYCINSLRDEDEGSVAGEVMLDEDKESVCSFSSCVQDWEIRENEEESEDAEEDGCLVRGRGGMMEKGRDGVGYCWRDDCVWCRWTGAEWRTANRRLRKRHDRERRKRRNPFVRWSQQREWLEEFVDGILSAPVEAREVFVVEADHRDPIQQAFGEAAIGFPTTRRPKELSSDPGYGGHRRGYRKMVRDI
jgi:hypothetical protein